MMQRNSKTDKMFSQVAYPRLFECKLTKVFRKIIELNIFIAANGEDLYIRLKHIQVTLKKKNRKLMKISEDYYYFLQCH